MLKNISNLGKALNKKEQKSITGGKPDPNPQEYCVCYTVSCASGHQYDGTYQFPVECDGSSWPPTYPVTFSAIIPAPACCV